MKKFSIYAMLLCFGLTFMGCTPPKPAEKKPETEAPKVDMPAETPEKPADAPVEKPADAPVEKPADGK
jgi:PBP1b-binding outer membrane lipoprotein LpoB